MIILVLNCGSSTVKFQLLDIDPAAPDQPGARRLAQGIVERIGGEAILTVSSNGKARAKMTQQLRDARAALDWILSWICSEESGINEVNAVCKIDAVGHRVVHGGEHFHDSALIDQEVVDGIEQCIDLAPLHNPANLKGIKAARDAFGPDIPQVAVFDTAFHQTLPEHSYLYAVPYQLYRRHRLRRYGFHGTSHRYVSERYRKIRGFDAQDVNIVTLHLGNGCSTCAIKGGKAVDTSMGLTPLEGLVMGTRSGDLDPAIVDFIAAKEGMSIRQVETLLNTQSGLVGISGLTNDMRELIEEAHENNDRRAQLAIDIFCYRARKYVGSYLAAMGGADALVFTGGIGENAAEVRSRICQSMHWFGLDLDQQRNLEVIGGREGLISEEGSRVRAYVIPTNEELLIAQDTARLVAARSPVLAQSAAGGQSRSDAVRGPGVAAAAENDGG